MKNKIRQAVDQDKPSILKIFNYYIENTFMAYPEKPIDMDIFDHLDKVHFPNQLYVIEQEDGKIAGFGMLKRIGPYEVFNHTAEVAYFIMPEYIRQGIGTEMLEFMTERAKAFGITTLMASISSLNPISIRFHEKNGFRHAGKFEKVGRKKGNYFDMVWMQKDI